jgi:hypothetical protein
MGRIKKAIHFSGITYVVARFEETDVAVKAKI